MNTYDHRHKFARVRVCLKSKDRFHPTPSLEQASRPWKKWYWCWRNSGASSQDYMQNPNRGVEGAVNRNLLLFTSTTSVWKYDPKSESQIVKLIVPHVDVALNWITWIISIPISFFSIHLLYTDRYQSVYRSAAKFVLFYFRSSIGFYTAIPLNSILSSILNRFLNTRDSTDINSDIK